MPKKKKSLSISIFLHLTSVYFNSHGHIIIKNNKPALFSDFRVKAVDSFMMEDYCVLVTASNDGYIKMWKLHLKEARLSNYEHSRV